MSSRARAANRGMRRKRTPFEWALLAVSVAAILTVVVGLVVSGSSGPSGPADLRVEVSGTRDGSGGRQVDIRVSNIGGTSAENVIVEVTMGEETREVDLDLVAKGEEVSAAAVFSPGAKGQPQAEVVGYMNP